MTTNEPPVGPDPEQPGGSVPPSPPPPSYPPADSSGGYGSGGDGPGGYGSGGYPPPPPGDSGFVPPFSAPDALSYGWKKFSADFGPWLVLGLITVGLVAIFVIATMFTSIGGAVVSTSGSTSFATMVMLFALSVVFTLTLSVVNALGTRGALDATEGRTFNIGDAFSRLDLPKVLVLGVILAVVGNLGSLVPTFLSFLVQLAGLVFTFFTFFAMTFVVDRGTDPIAALTESFELIKAHLGDSLLLAVLAVLVSLAGACLCGLGLFVAYPVVAIAVVYAYRRFQDQPVA